MLAALLHKSPPPSVVQTSQPHDHSSAKEKDDRQFPCNPKKKKKKKRKGHVCHFVAHLQRVQEEHFFFFGGYRGIVHPLPGGTWVKCIQCSRPQRTASCRNAYAWTLVWHMTSFLHYSVDTLVSCVKIAALTALKVDVYCRTALLQDCVALLSVAASCLCTT